jgi:hypothetical protein
MVSLIEGRDIRGAVDEIITGSTRFLVLASQEITLPDRLKEHLDRGTRGVPDIRLYYRNHFIVNDKSDITFLQEHLNIQIYVCDRLHMNIFMNELTGIITSFNLYEFPGSSPIDFGVLFSKTDDEALYSCVLTAMRTIESGSSIQTDFYGSPLKMGEVQQEEDRGAESPEEKRFFSKFLHEALGGGGYCIACGAPMRYQRDHPFCPHCMNKQAGCSDSNEPGFYCHNCGAAARVTLNIPFCRRCLSAIRTN